MNMSTDQLTAHESIEIAAAPERVWQVLTDPDLTRRYMFGCVPITDWKVGSPLSWRGTLDGKDQVFVSGDLLAVERPSLLSYTTYDPAAATPDPPAKRARVICRLTSPRPGTTRLEVSQGDFAGLPDAARRFEETRSGWHTVVSEIKKLAES
jgi:uncharacterized protein YndB with AHSA1/START domain